MMPRTLAVSTVAVALLLAAGCHSRKADDTPPKPVAAEAVATPVAVELFVMSRCPYGVQAENALFPALEQLGDAVDFRLHFIGGVEDDGSLTSMHGEPELRGNLLQVCAAKIAPRAYRGVISCMNIDPQSVPDSFGPCAQKAGLDVAAVTACADGDEGKALLKASFQHAEQLGVQGSPSMAVNGKPFEGPRTTESYLRALCGLVTGSKPAVCATLPVPVTVPLTVLTDPRCEPCGKAVEIGLQQLRGIFPGLKDRVLEYGSDEGKALYATLRAAEQKFLPAFLFSAEVTKDPSFAQIEKYFEEAGPYRLLTVDAGFDPTAEICGNGTDDDGNGKIDCDDPGCAADFACRPERKGTLEVFVMSQCPYGVVAMNAMKEVLATFGKKMDFKVHFLADVGEDGAIDSLHGQAEVDEDLRQICASAKYGKDNLWLDYVWCRNQALESPDWKACAKGPIKAAVIEKCAKGPEGRKLLAADAAIGQELGVSASPSWLVNNRQPASALTADEIRQIFCTSNAGTPGCEKTLSNDAGGAPTGGGCQAK
jgi:glutaredoxin